MEYWKGLFDIIQSLITSAGIIVGGIWTYMVFVRQRLGFPRVTIDLSIHDTILPGSLRYVHAELKIANTGSVLLRSHRAELRLRQVVPIPECLELIIREGYDPVLTGKTEVEWPLIAGREWEWQAGSFEIEPGESDCLHSDFVIPVDLEVSEFYFFIANAKKKAQGIGWTLTKIHRFLQKEGEKTMANQSGVEIRAKQSETKTPVKKQQKPQNRQQQQQPTQQQQQQQQQQVQPKKAQ